MKDLGQPYEGQLVESAASGNSMGALGRELAKAAEIAALKEKLAYEKDRASSNYDSCERVKSKFEASFNNAKQLCAALRETREALEPRVEVTPLSDHKGTFCKECWGTLATTPDYGHQVITGHQMGCPVAVLARYAGLVEGV